MCKSSISPRAYIQKVCKELTGSLNGATKSINFGRSTRFNTSATRKLKKKSVTPWDCLLQRTGACGLVNCPEIEQLTSVQCVKAQYVESDATYDACRACNKTLKACLFC